MKYKGFFQDKTALITGAANGLGRALAKILANEACHLILIDIDAESLEEASNELTYPDLRISKYSLDISIPERVKELKAEVLPRHSNIHFLFNCAGVSVTAPFLEQSLEDLHWLMSINYFGSLYICHTFLPILLKADQGHIVNVSSGIAFQGLPNRTAYTSSKFAIRGFSEALRAELFHTSARAIACVKKQGTNC